MSKKKRIIDKDLLASYKDIPCICCYPDPQKSPTEADHITSRGAGGDDVPINLLPICREHHILRHKVGLGGLIKRHPIIEIWLKNAGRQDVLDRIERFK